MSILFLFIFIYEFSKLREWIPLLLYSILEDAPHPTPTTKSNLKLINTSLTHAYVVKVG